MIFPEKHWLPLVQTQSFGSNSAVGSAWPPWGPGDSASHFCLSGDSELPDPEPSLFIHPRTCWGPRGPSPTNAKREATGAQSWSRDGPGNSVWSSTAECTCAVETTGGPGPAWGEQGRGRVILTVQLYGMFCLHCSDVAVITCSFSHNFWSFLRLETSYLVIWFFSEPMPFFLKLQNAKQQGKVSFLFFPSWKYSVFLEKNPSVS